VLFEESFGFDGAVGREDIVLCAVAEEEGAFGGSWQDGGLNREGAGEADGTGGWGGQGREGVQERHGALGEAEEGGVGAGDPRFGLKVV